MKYCQKHGPELNPYCVDCDKDHISNSDTPETDHTLHGVWYRGDHGSAIPALCRRLERERDEAARILRRLLRSHGEKSSSRSVSARSDAGLWLVRYDKANDEYTHPESKP